MYWFSRPPYWRWAAAVALVTLAAFMDLTGPPTESYPFTAVPTMEGESIEIEWRQIPAGILPSPGNVNSVAAFSIPAGTPLLPSVVAAPGRAPRDWWAMAAPLPAGAMTGGEILVTTPELEVAGLVITSGAPDTFGNSQDGVIAVPPADAAAVAAALATGSALVLIRP